MCRPCQKRKTVSRSICHQTTCHRTPPPSPPGSQRRNRLSKWLSEKSEHSRLRQPSQLRLLGLPLSDARSRLATRCSKSGRRFRRNRPTVEPAQYQLSLGCSGASVLTSCWIKTVGHTARCPCDRPVGWWAARLNHCIIHISRFEVSRCMVLLPSSVCAVRGRSEASPRWTL